MEESMIVIRNPKTSFSNFDQPKYVDENLKHEVKFIIKSNEYLTENKIKNDIEQLLLKHKDENNINEHGSSKKHVSPQNLSIYYTWKNIRKQ